MIMERSHRQIVESKGKERAPIVVVGLLKCSADDCFRLSAISPADC